MSVSALHSYEQLTDAPDDNIPARIIVEAIGQLEDRFSQLSEVATAVATAGNRVAFAKGNSTNTPGNQGSRGSPIKRNPLTGLKITENASKIAETKAELVRWVVVGAGLLQTILISGILLRVAHVINTTNSHASVDCKP